MSDPVEVKPRIKKTVWMNIYESDNYFIWPRKSDAAVDNICGTLVLLFFLWCFLK